MGDFFVQEGLTYKVIGEDAQGRPISTLCAPEPESEDEVEEIEEIEEEPKQETLLNETSETKTTRRRGRK